MWNICRTCMSKGEEMISIFNQGKSPTINTMIMAISSLEFSPSDLLPSQMCNTCFESLEMTYYFKKQLIRCNNELQKQAETSKLLALPLVIEEEKEERKCDEHVCDQDECITIDDSSDTSTDDNASILDDPASTFSEQLISVENSTYDNLSELSSSLREDDLRQESLSGDIQVDDSHFEENCYKSEEVDIEEHGVQFQEYREVRPLQIITETEANNAECTGSFNESQEVQINSNQNVEETRIASESMERSIDVVCLSSDKAYKCTYCNATFRCSANLDQHITLHTSGAMVKSHKCEICERIFSRHYNLLRHLRTHSSKLIENNESNLNEPLPTCPQPLTSINSDTYYACLSSDDNQDIGFHLKQMGTKYEEVEVEENIVQYEDEISSPQSAQTSLVPGVPSIESKKLRDIECPSSDKKKCKSRLELPNGLKCDICEKYCPSPSTLKVHMRSHAIERPFHCPYCTTRFKHHYHLKRHIRMHTDEKSHKCEVCGRTFYRADNLNNHIKTHKIFKCPHCNAIRTGDMDQHIRICMMVKTQPIQGPTSANIANQPTIILI